MRLLIAVVLILATVPFASSQTTNQKVSEASKDEQELKRLEDEWLNTYLRGDKGTFDRIVADDFSGTDESAVLRNKAQEKELVIAPPPGGIKVSLTNEDVQVRIYGDTAIVTGRIVQEAERVGQDSFGFQSRFTDTFLKRQGRWQVVARHYSRIPLERTAIKVDPKIYDAYVGEYEIATNIVFHVSKEGDKLMSQTTGQPKAEMLPESETGFFVKGIPAQFIFIRDEKGQVARMIVLQDGRTISMKRIK
jgi:ketosteroid isomerase-like protein